MFLIKTTLVATVLAVAAIMMLALLIRATEWEGRTTASQETVTEANAQ